MDVTATIPKITRAAVYRPGTIELAELPLEPPAEGELLVRLSACGICSSEVLRWYADSKAPFALGHEPVGVVVACGENAGPQTGVPFSVGERVFVHHHVPCMRCRQCLRGDYVQCADWRAPALRPGGMSQFATVSRQGVRHDVLRIPSDVNDERATFIEPLATVLKSVRRSSLRPGDRALVIGLGPMGMLHALVAKHRGAPLVIGADSIAARLEKAKDFGIDVACDASPTAKTTLKDQVHSATGGNGAEVVFVTPGTLDAIQLAVESVARGGTIVLFTPLPPQVAWQLPVHDLFFKDVNVVTSYSAGPDDTKESLMLLTSGLPVDALITHRFSLDQVGDAYSALKDSSTALKIVVFPNS